MRPEATLPAQECVKVSEINTRCHRFHNDKRIAFATPFRSTIDKKCATLCDDCF